MSDFSVDTTELTKLGANAAAAQAMVMPELRDAMSRSVVEVEARAKVLVPVDTGHLRRSITNEVTATGDGVIGKVGSNVPYAVWVETGRNPGTAPSEAEIAPWARRKGIPEEAIFAVAQAIGRRGTKGKPYLRPALKSAEAKIAKEFQQVIPRILKKLGGV